MNEPVDGLQINLLKYENLELPRVSLNRFKQIYPKCGNLGAYSQECLSRD
jgi:hypothetical protein